MEIQNSSFYETFSRIFLRSRANLV